MKRLVHVAVLLACGMSIAAPAAAQLTATDRQAILDAHNQARCDVNPPAAVMPGLVWDDDLATVAQAYADTGVLSFNADRVEQYQALGHPGVYVGENIAGGTSLGGPAAVALWTSAASFFEAATNTCASGEECRYYTQVVWANTLAVGCGKVTLKDLSFYICDYAPGGSISGEAPYVPGSGTNAACSAAGSGNAAPTADAGSDQLVAPGGTVTLDGSLSADPESASLTFTWTQTAGPAVALDLSAPSAPMFVAPNAGSAATTLTFSLVVSDGSRASIADAIDVSVLNGTLPAGGSAAPGPAGQAGPAGPSGPPGPAGSDALAPAGTIILLEEGTAAPAGYSLIGSTQINVRPTSGNGVRPTTFLIYRKN